MDGGMDEWIHGYVDIYMGTWVDGYMMIDGQMDRQIDRQTDK